MYGSGLGYGCGLGLNYGYGLNHGYTLNQGCTYISHGYGLGSTYASRYLW